MKNRFLLVLACFLCSVSVYPQVEHAPTVAQCQADQRLWFSKLEEPEPKLLAFDVIREWSHEMLDCEKVDPENKLKYYNVEGEVEAEKVSRLAAFINRHGLWEQFKTEDAAGKR
jgi:hypothetical protein